MGDAVAASAVAVAVADAAADAAVVVVWVFGAPGRSMVPGRLGPPRGREARGGERVVFADGGGTGEGSVCVREVEVLLVVCLMMCARICEDAWSPKREIRFSLMASMLRFRVRCVVSLSLCPFVVSSLLLSSSFVSDLILSAPPTVFTTNVLGKCTHTPAPESFWRSLLRKWTCRFSRPLHSGQTGQTNKQTNKQ